MAARFGKEGIRQFLYTLRKSIVATSDDSIYQQAFRMTPKEFDEAFEKWIKERFKPFRDRQRPTDYGMEISPDPEKTSFSQVYAFAPSPSGEVVAAITGNRNDGEADIVMLSTKDGSVVKNLTKGYTGKYEGVTFPGEISSPDEPSTSPPRATPWLLSGEPARNEASSWCPRFPATW